MRGKDGRKKIAMKSDIESNGSELMELRLMCTKSVITFFTSL